MTDFENFFKEIKTLRGLLKVTIGGLVGYLIANAALAIFFILVTQYGWGWSIIEASFLIVALYIFVLLFSKDFEKLADNMILLFKNPSSANQLLLCVHRFLIESITYFTEVPLSPPRRPLT